MAAKTEKKKIDVFVDPVITKTIPPFEPTSGWCACGEPVAAGQTYVCKKHIRSS